MVEELRRLAELGPESEFEGLSELLLAARRGPPDPERVVLFAGRAVRNSEHCGLTLFRGRARPRSIAASGEVPRLVDSLQYETGQGPCLQASTSSDVVLAENLETDQRWPEFGPLCVAETPVRSMVSVPLFLAGDDRASINFYAEKPNAFDELDVGLGAIFGPFAALSLQSAMHEQEAAQLQVALNSSRRIGTAIGILVAREQITSQQAFARLVHASQHQNRKLRDIAAEVEQTGRLPGVPGGKTDG